MQSTPYPLLFFDLQSSPTHPVPLSPLFSSPLSLFLSLITGCRLSLTWLLTFQEKSRAALSDSCCLRLSLISDCRWNSERGASVLNSGRCINCQRAEWSLQVRRRLVLSGTRAAALRLDFLADGSQRRLSIISLWSAYVKVEIQPWVKGSICNFF